MTRALALACLLAACGKTKIIVGADFSAYDDQRLYAIGSQINGTSGVFISNPHAACVNAGTCFAAAEDDAFCPSIAQPADIGIIGGVLIHTFCYPAESRVVVTSATKGDVTVSSEGAVITFDDSSLGNAFRGNLNITASGVTIWGNGANATLFKGSLIVSAPHAAVRGVRIDGTVQTTAPLALVLSTINSDAALPQNSALVESIVFGKVVTSNSFVIGNEVQNTFTVQGGNCDGNVAFFDADGNGEVGQDELGSPLVCK